MKEDALNAAIVDRIMGVVDENIDAYYSHGSRDFVVSEVSSIIASVLGENDAEIARLNESHYTVCRGLAESILIIVRKLADRDIMIDRLICYADHDDTRDANGVPEQSSDLKSLLAECRAMVIR